MNDMKQQEDEVEITVQLSWKTLRESTDPISGETLIDALNDAAAGLGFPRVGHWQIMVDREDPVVQSLNRQINALRREVDRLSGVQG